MPDDGELSQQASLQNDLLNINSLQNIMPNNGDASQQMLLPNDQLNLNSLQEFMPKNGGLSQQELLLNDQRNLNCLQSIVLENGESLQQGPLSNDLLNLNSLPLDIYPALGETSLQNLSQPALQPLLQESLSTGSTGGNPYSLNHTGREYLGQLDNTGREYPGQFASSELYNFPMAPAIIPMLPMDENLIDGNIVAGGTSPLQHDPAPDLSPAHPLLVDIETTSSEVYHYNVSPSQNLAQPTAQAAIFEETNNPVGQNQDSNADNQLSTQRNGKRGPFRDQVLREQTAQTRRMGSCLRCRMQRIRVSGILL
jgi:hypothetical protein